MAKIKIDLNALASDNWTENERENVKRVTDFVQNLMNNHDFNYVLKEHGTGAYKQHNRSMLDGIKGVVAYVSKFVKSFPDFTYDVKHIYADGDFVIFHSHSTTSKKDRGNPRKGFNIIDIWKVKNGQLVEHWDSIQPINGFMRLYALYAGGAEKNNNTLF